MAELFRHDITDLHRLMAAGGLSPVDLLAHYEERIARYDPTLNTIVAANPLAGADAVASAERYAKGEALGPLDGIPCTIKDNIPVCGMPCSWGSAILTGWIPEEEEPVVARLRAAGAVILGKTNCPEIALEGYTANATFGITRNPWNPELTPGGSSGGAVAGVAAGLATFAIGTDGGGSIRRPAGHTGLVGLKPTIGRIPRAHTLPQIMLDLEVAGPITRTVSDCAKVFAALHGPDRADPASLYLPPVEPRPGPLRILLVERFADSPVDPLILKAVNEAADHLAGLGHQIERGPLPLAINVLQAQWPVIGQAGLAWLKQQWGERFASAAASHQAMAAAGECRPAADYLGLVDTIRGLRAEAAELFHNLDLIMTPTAAAQPWAAAEAFPPMIDGIAVGPRGHAIFTGWVNAIGHPAIALPAGPDAEGLPIGYQLVGGFGAEHSLLALAAAIEQARPWSGRWPALAAT